MNTYDESIKAADAYTRRVEMRLPEINAKRGQPGLRGLG